METIEEKLKAGKIQIIKHLPWRCNCGYFIHTITWCEIKQHFICNCPWCGETFTT